MEKTIINFGHANGFPSGVYSKLFDSLGDEFTVIYKDMYAHDPKYPIISNWMKSADEMIAFIESNTNEPVVGIGHSFGASTTLNAAFKKPELFKAIILIEPVILNGWMSKLAPIADALDIFKYFSPAMKSKGRREHWPDLESAETYFRSKRLFNQLDETCFQDYLKYGLRKTDDGYVLAFEVEKELDIFSVMKYNFDRYRNRLKTLPGKIISADKTSVSKPKFMSRLAKQHNFEWEIVEGSHMLPLENPVYTAELIKKFIASI
ncbi:MAG: alpha/beta hydrolase [Chitinophagales bacterium]